MSVFEEKYLPVLKSYADARIDIDMSNDAENAVLVELENMGLIHMMKYVYKNKKIAIRAMITPQGKQLLKLFED